MEELDFREAEEAYRRFEDTNNKWIFGDIRFSALNKGPGGVTSSNVCSVKGFSLVSKEDCSVKKFFRGGDAERGRCRNKIKAWIKWVEDRKKSNPADNLGVYHWVFGTSRLIDEWKEFDEACKRMGRYLEDYIMVIEQGEKGRRLHIHLLTPYFYSWDALKSLWHQVNGVEKGLHVRVEKGDLKASDYLSKYCAKEARMPGRRLFRQAKNLQQKYGKFLPEKKGEIWVSFE